MAKLIYTPVEEKRLKSTYTIKLYAKYFDSCLYDGESEEKLFYSRVIGLDDEAPKGMDTVKFVKKLLEQDLDNKEITEDNIDDIDDLIYDLFGNELAGLPVDSEDNSPFSIRVEVMFYDLDGDKYECSIED